MIDLYLRLVCWWRGHQWKPVPTAIKQIGGLNHTCGRCFAWTDAIPLPGKGQS